MVMNMIKIKNLHKSYNSLKVLDGLNLNVDKGDVYGFVDQTEVEKQQP